MWWFFFFSPIRKWFQSMSQETVTYEGNGKWNLFFLEWLLRPDTAQHAHIYIYIAVRYITLTQLNTQTTKTFTFACLYTHTYTHLTRLMQVSPCGYMTATLCQASRVSDDCWVILELSGLPVWMIFCLCAALWEGSHFRKRVFSHTPLHTIYYLNPPPTTLILMAAP